MDSYDQPLSDATRSTLARLGASVEFSEHYPDGNIDLTESDVTDEDLPHLVFYPGFAGLQLARTSISNAGVRFVGQMRDVESLSLHNTKITDDALAELRGLIKLEELFIGTDPG